MVNPAFHRGFHFYKAAFFNPVGVWKFSMYKFNTYNTESCIVKIHNTNSLPDIP